MSNNDEVKLNKKFIRTLVNEKPAFLIMSKCNMCPFFNIDDKNKQGYCLKYKDENDSSVIKYIYSYSFKYITNVGIRYYPAFDIDIPKWCLLTNKLTSDVDYNVYVKNKVDKVDIIIENSTILDLISDRYIEYSEFTGNLVRNKHYKDFISGTENNFNKLTNKKQENIVVEDNSKKEICSCCGNNKTNTERNFHLGMCYECWINYKWNRKIKIKSFINNFRLKRNVEYINDVKIIDDFKHKVLIKNE
jgi:hypothetical protein